MRPIADVLFVRARLSSVSQMLGYLLAINPWYGASSGISHVPDARTSAEQELSLPSIGPSSTVLSRLE
jgi:hypothetical protein